MKKRNLYIIVVLPTMFLSQFLEAQIRKFQLIDQEKSPLAFMDITVNSQFTGIFTDEKGYFSIDLDAYRGSDVIGMLTSFFDTDIAKVEVLKKQKKSAIRVANKTITLDPVVIRAEVRDPKKLAALIAGIFTERYGKQDYFVNSCCIKTVQSHGTYREFSAAMGVAFFAKYATELVKFLWDDPARYFFGFYDRMQSDLFQCGNNDVLNVKRINSNDNFNLSFDSDFMNMQPIEALRAVEIYSPMNAKALSFFSYSLDSVFVRGEDKIVVLSFKSNPSAFPRKSRLLGEGLVVFNSSQNIVEQIELLNFRQYYATSVHNLTDRPSRHKMYLRLSFHNTGEKMYIKELYYRRNWDKEPPQGTNNYYYSSVPARRNPVRNGLEEVFYVLYDEKMGYFSQGSPASESTFSANVVNWLYEVPHTPDLWKSCIALRAFPMNKVEADLGIKEPLNQQFVKHSRESFPRDMYESEFKNPNHASFSKRFPTYESLTEQCNNNLRYLRQAVLPIINVSLTNF